jgi:hypothetical protein
VQQDFKPRGLKHWFKDVLRVGIVGSCLLSLCFAKMETVPYTKREYERFCYKGELLPSTDPESMRVNIIHS